MLTSLTELRSYRIEGTDGEIEDIKRILPEPIRELWP